MGDTVPFLAPAFLAVMVVIADDERAGQLAKS
jgi:hypothetical protein